MSKGAERLTESRNNDKNLKWVLNYINKNFKKGPKINEEAVFVLRYSASAQKETAIYYYYCNLSKIVEQTVNPPCRLIQKLESDQPPNSWLSALLLPADESGLQQKFPQDETTGPTQAQKLRGIMVKIKPLQWGETIWDETITSDKIPSVFSPVGVVFREKSPGLLDQIIRDFRAWLTELENKGEKPNRHQKNNHLAELILDAIQPYLLALPEKPLKVSDMLC